MNRSQPASVLLQCLQKVAFVVTSSRETVREPDMLHSKAVGNTDLKKKKKIKTNTERLTTEYEKIVISFSVQSNCTVLTTETAL